MERSDIRDRRFRKYGKRGPVFRCRSSQATQDDTLRLQHGTGIAMTAIHDLSADALSSGYRTRSVSPVEAVRAALARIEAWEGKINAMYAVDAAGALAQAAKSEARWRTGEPLSALDGVPITIKDNIAVKGISTPVGTAAGDLTPAVADAPPSARVREAGCVILGKTTMPDFGMLASGISSLHGTTRN